MGFTQLIRAGFATMNMDVEVSISGLWDVVWMWKWWISVLGDCGYTGC